MVHSIASILEVLAGIESIGVRSQEPIAGLADELRPEDDTYTNGALNRGQRLAMFRLAASEDQLIAVSVALKARRASPCFGLARAAAEMAAQALWLLEPSETRQRAARYSIDRWNGLRALSLLQPNEREKLREHAAEEARGLELEGFDVGWSEGWPRQIDGVGKANYMEQVAGSFPRREMGEEAYRLLSAFAHGHEFGFEDLIATVEGRQVLAVSSQQLIVILRLAIWPYLASIKRYSEITGFNSQPIANDLRDVLVSLDHGAGQESPA
ncbi:MAG TPA: hypothetical protein VF006_30850 [Longimicrobium sp.]